MIRKWQSTLLENADNWNVPAEGIWRPLFFNNYQPNYSTITLLWFHNGDMFPRVVTKLFRDESIPRKEFDNLGRMYSRAPQFVPRPFHFGQDDDFWALWMEGVPGLPLPAGSRYSRDVLHSMIEMLVSIHAAGRQPAAVGDPDRYSRFVTEPIDALTHFGLSSIVQEGCERLRSDIPRDFLSVLPIIPQHGDLFAGNALVHHGQWHVIDWESYGEVDLPCYDLFTLLFSLLKVNGDISLRWEPRLVAEVPSLVGLYAERLAVPPATLAFLLPLSLANWFHVQWRDGRKEFAARMYRTMEDYFQNTAAWERVFIGQRA